MRQQSSPQTNETPEGEAPQQTVSLSDVPANLVWKAAGAFGVALVAGLLFIELFTAMIRPLSILLGGIVLATALAPLADRLERLVPRSVAVLLIFLAILAVVTGIGYVLIQPLVSEVESFIDSVPGYINDIQFVVTEVFEVDLEGAIQELFGWIQPALSYVVSVPLMVFNTGLEIFIWVFLTLYWLYSMPRLKAFVVSLFPPHHQQNASVILARMGTRMGGYVRGVMISGTIVGAVVYIGLTVLDVRYALLLALLSFLGEFFPNIGPIIAAVPAVLIGALDSIELGLILILFFVVIQQMESYILTPVVMSGQVQIPPLATTFVVFAGFLIGGILWAILAIPISGAILTLITDVVAPAIRRKTGAQPPVAQEEDVLIGPQLPKHGRSG